MEWKNVKDEGIPSIGEKVLLFSNGVIQEAIYFIDATDGEYSYHYFWDSEDQNLDEGVEIKESDWWLPLSQIAKPL